MLFSSYHLCTNHPRVNAWAREAAVAGNSPAFLGRLKFTLNLILETLLLKEEIHTDTFKTSLFFRTEFHRDNINEVRILL